ncbi:hypothetical protein NDU88_001146 [Pleurodeles waltl]|uniref:Uncharacterized protein n=1 Tax=Pleurodeles waltl TaxID=8319 RepID=A0AAV7P2V1_PLEWA|nr:hypothetical protein NDU88_001146 [Pleurodeles waltl]
MRVSNPRFGLMPLTSCGILGRAVGLKEVTKESRTGGRRQPKPVELKGPEPRKHDGEHLQEQKEHKSRGTRCALPRSAGRGGCTPRHVEPWTWAQPWSTGVALSERALQRPVRRQGPDLAWRSGAAGALFLAAP